MTDKDTARWDRAWAPPIVFRCASYPPHVLSIVDIYLAQPVIPRSSFYSPPAPKCLFRQDWFNYSHRQCTVHPPVCIFYSHRHLPYVSNDPNPPPINDPVPCISVIQWDSFVSTNHNAWIISAQATHRAQPPIPIPILQNPYFNYRLLFCYLIFLLYNLHCTMRSCVRPPLSCSGVPHTPPHVLSIVDIYLAQPVIPRSSFYSPPAPKCLFRQDGFNYSHWQCTVQPPVCVFHSHRHLPYVSNDPNPPPINDPLPCISYPMRLIRIDQSQRLDPFRTSNTQSTTAYSYSNFTKSLFQL
jgi:hypothetical protein